MMSRNDSLCVTEVHDSFVFLVVLVVFFFLSIQKIVLEPF